ncbi:MAG TPA: hypothetical protein VJV97_08590 [Gemmatimonadaceae bacterium]|nr:hypothetical protein [Gemmatimonadaceae bacterium]
MVRELQLPSAVTGRRVMLRTLREALERFVRQPDPKDVRMQIEDTVALRFHRASELHSTMFILGGSADHDGGGFVIAELLRNLSICITDKTEKVAARRDRYQEWWLILVDEIAYGSLDPGDIDQLRGLFDSRSKAGWSTIVLVSPLDPARAIEL